MLGIVQNIPDFMVYTGTEALLLDILKKGGAGCITATANLIAPECQRVYQAWKINKQKVAEQAQMNLTDLRKSLENYPLVSELKSLFAAHTNAEEWENMLPPFAPILDKQVEELTEQIKGLGLDLKLRL
ncbi:MAG: dihydrodipicolinate synthase family protein, partial [Candidatus Lambdaproteobacteria bacterium]